MRGWVIAGIAGAALGLLPALGHAQSSLTTIQRNQQRELEINRNTLSNSLTDRYQQQLELEKQFYDENRRRREDYRFQGNTQQRALENQLREDDQRNRDADRRTREVEEKQRQEQIRGFEEARRRSGGG